MKTYARIVGIVMMGLCGEHAVAAPPGNLIEDRAAREAYINALQNIDVPSDPALSPDQSKVAFTLTTAEKKPGERTRPRNIRIINANGKGESIELCRNCWRPRWAPNGRQIVHFATVESKTVLLMTDVANKTSKTLFPTASTSEGEWGPGQFEWAPNGKLIALVAARPTPSGAAPTPVVTAVFDDFKPLVLHQDEVMPKRIGLINPSAASLRWLTDDTVRVGGFPETAFAWSPDSKRIAFSARANNDRADVFQQDRIAIVAIDGLSPVRMVADSTHPQSHPFWLDNRTIGFQSMKNSSSDRVEVMTVREGSSPKMVPLADDYFIGRTTLPQFQASLGGIAQIFVERSSKRIAVFGENQSQLRFLTPAQNSVSGHTFSADAKTVVVTMTRADAPIEIFIGKTSTKGEIQLKKLTDFGRPARQAGLNEVRKIKWRSLDNRFDVEGFLVMPPNFSPQNQYPLIVIPFGGPSTYQNSYEMISIDDNSVWPAQLYASMGYLVLMPGRRGDVGYGRVYSDAFVGGWGDDVMYDVDGGAEYLVSKGWADPKRLGIAGFSYGGYSTAWAITHTDRYAAASFMDGPLDIPRFALQNSPSWDGFFSYFFNKPPVEAIEDMWDRSPLRYVANVKTPFMAMAANAPRGTFRWGFADDTTAFFSAAHQRGVPSQLFIFNREFHGIVDPQVRMDYLDRNVRWFNHWLLGKGEIRTDLPQGNAN